MGRAVQCWVTGVTTRRTEPYVFMDHVSVYVVVDESPQTKLAYLNFCTSVLVRICMECFQNSPYNEHKHKHRGARDLKTDTRLDI